MRRFLSYIFCITYFILICTLFYCFEPFIVFFYFHIFLSFFYKGGVLTCQTTTGNLNPIIHPFFDHLPETIAAVAGISVNNTRDTNRDKNKDNHSKESGSGQTSDKKSLLAKFCQSLALMKLDCAWQAGSNMFVYVWS